MVCDPLAWLGAAIDVEANGAAADVVSAAGGRVALRVIATNEEMTIARHIRTVLTPDR